MRQVIIAYAKVYLLYTCTYTQWIE